MRNLELASYVCEEYFGQGIKMSHPPLINDVDLFEFMLKNGLILDSNLDIYWQDNWTTKYESTFLMEGGVCQTFNQISANLIFRNNTLDPKFLKQYSLGSSKRDPQSWSIEDDYSSDGTNFYPLKSLTVEKGLEVFIGADFPLEEDTYCRNDPEFIQIALHHPAEVAPKTSFIKMPFRKSVSLMVKPKITKTSDSLRSYDPEV
jgi:hypothetical protein